LCTSDRRKPLVVGSIKPNIGHTETAAGVAGVIKAVLALQHKIIPQQIHLNALNPNFLPLEGKIIIPTKPHQFEGAHNAAGNTPHF
jgi:acyl transferase domain-containing protein